MFLDLSFHPCPVARQQKSQHTLATTRRAAGPKLFYSFPPPKGGFPSLSLASLTLEAFSMLGEALIGLLLRHHYHMGKDCQGSQDAINRRFN